MENLFQNKNLLFTPLEKYSIAKSHGVDISLLRKRRLMFRQKFLMGFTLILIASCFGILGMGGEIFADEYYRCDNNSVTYGGRTANDLCTDIGRDDCKNEKDYDHAFCVENNKKSVRFGCKSAWGGITCDCDPNLFEVKDCPDGCVNGKCKTSSTPPAAACESVKGQICCDSKDCRSVVTGKNDPKECSSGICCKKEYWKCESIITQECVDISECVNNVNAILSDPKYCSGGLVCVKRGECKTNTGCTDGECNYSTKKYCDGGTWSSFKYCSNCEKNKICGDGECNCGETTTSCSVDCKTTTPNPCFWISFDDKGQNCKDTERAEICGPNDCTTGVCNDNNIPRTRGFIRCVKTTTGGGASGNGGSQDKYTGGGGVVSFTNPLSTDSFEALIMGIINWILGIVVSLAILFLIIGGLMYITSAGDEERIKKAKNIILYAILGLGIVILSWSIITELKDILGVVENP